MSDTRPLLMIPGPVEISPAVAAAAAAAPRSHLDPELVAAYGRALAAMRRIWLAEPASQPFAVPGGGTLAMESAATNLMSPGERALVVSSGYFGERMAEMLGRRGVEVAVLGAPPGDAPDAGSVGSALAAAESAGAPFKAIFVTHVDTSSGVRVDPQPLAELARRHGALSVIDGVCATAGERFAMAEWGADLCFTASQKALGLPPGLALWVAGPRALAARAGLAAPPPLTFDWNAWRPVMEAYEAGRGSYFSTPPTTLVAALDVGLAELLREASEPVAAMAAVVERHARAARALGAAWEALGLAPVPVRAELRAATLSALRFPAGRGNELLGAIRERGVIVAGGLLPALSGSYFRVGHMGEVTRHPEALQRTVRAIGDAIGGASAARAAAAAFVAAW